MSLELEKVENLVSVLSSMKEQLDALMKSLADFDRILIAEEKAIQTSDLILIEKIVPEKLRIGSEVERSIQLLKSHLEQFFQGGWIMRSHSSKAALDLSDLIVFLMEVDGRLDRSNLASQVLTHLSAKIKLVVNEVIQFRKKLQPKIEANSYLVRKLLVHHQETYRFWQSLVLEAESVYNSYGTTKSAKSQSILEVKT